jgi:formylglycine-generating enzyme required for sulfatase activity
VSAFKLESFEVTVGRFRSFVTAGLGTSTTAPTVGAGAHPKIAGSGWQATWNSLLPLDTPALKQVLTGGTWTDAAGANEHKPITNVPWMVAFAFCAADGARLPTQAEWDFAAAGGADQRVYPWSMPPSSTAIGFAQAAYQCGFALPAESCPASVCSVGGASPCVAVTCAAGGGSCSAPPCTGCDMGADVAPVGSLAAGRGRYGHYDLAGNAAELVLDAISEKNGNANVLPTPCLDCASLMPASPFTGGPKSTSVFALGGDWSGAPAAVRTDAYTTMRFGMSSPYVAFRCARD